jgi:hypothetical protein
MTARAWLCALILTGFLLHGHARVAEAQELAEPGAAGAPTVDPYWAKALAKAEREATPGDLRKLMLARRNAVQVELEARFKEFLTGRGTRDILHEAARHWLESERSLQDDPAGPAAALESCWALTWAIEEINKGWFEAGRVPHKEYMESRYERLTAEIDLLRERSRQKKPLPLAGGPPFLVNENEIGPIPARLLAKAKAKASQTDVRELAQERLKVAELAFGGRIRAFLAGFASQTHSLEAARRWLQADLAVRDEVADRLAAHERYWELVYLIDANNLTRYEAGRIPIQDRQHSLYFRLEAELWLLEALKGLGKPLGLSQRPLSLVAEGEPINLRAIARAKYAAVHADPRQLVRAKLAAATEESEGRWQEFLAGRGTQDILLGALERRLESELALTVNPPDRLAAHEKHWRQLQLVEAVDQARYEAARIPIQDYMQARHARLDAQIRIARARKQ